MVDDRGSTRGLLCGCMQWERLVLEINGIALWTCEMQSFMFGMTNTVAMLKIQMKDALQSSSSTSIDSLRCPLLCPFVGLALATDASLSIICRETDTMLSSISCWPTSSRSGAALA